MKLNISVVSQDLDIYDNLSNRIDYVINSLIKERYINGEIKETDIIESIQNLRCELLKNYFALSGEKYIHLHSSLTKADILLENFKLYKRIKDSLEKY